MTPLWLMITITALYAVGWAAAAVLVYRYSRYTKWRSTAIGRAFMRMKVVLLVLFSYLLVARWLPFWLQVVLVLLIVSGIDLALIRQAKVIVKLQGGWRRNRPVDHESLAPISVEK